MANKKKKSPNNVINNQSAVENVAENSVPKFEIGVKGDEFDIKYRRAAATVNNDAERLLDDLGRESKADKYNFLSFSISAVLIALFSLSIILVSRGDIEEIINIKPTAKTILIDGSYTRNLNEVYEKTLPFGDEIRTIGSCLGFLPKVQKEDEILPEIPEQPDQPDEPSDEPEVSLPTLQVTEPTTALTTAPITTVATTVPTTEETTAEEEIFQTFIMYANATLNIRLGPSTNDAILGYYSTNDPVEVIEIRTDGWAAVLYNDIKAYVFAQYLGNETVVTTIKTTARRTESTTAENIPEITSAPDETGDFTLSPSENELQPDFADTNDNAENGDNSDDSGSVNPDESQSQSDT